MKWRERRRKTTIPIEYTRPTEVKHSKPFRSPSFPLYIIFFYSLPHVYTLLSVCPFFFTIHFPLDYQLSLLFSFSLFVVERHRPSLFPSRFPYALSLFFAEQPFKLIFVQSDFDLAFPYILCHTLLLSLFLFLFFLSLSLFLSSD